MWAIDRPSLGAGKSGTLCIDRQCTAVKPAALEIERYPKKSLP
jgi:hypothetical protein